MNLKNLEDIIEALQLKYKPIIEQCLGFPSVLGIEDTDTTHLDIYVMKGKFYMHALNIHMNWAPDPMAYDGDNVLLIEIKRSLRKGQSIDDYIKQNFVPQYIGYLG